MYKRHGFTLIELMIGIVIVGILLSIAIPNYVRIRDRSKEAQTRGAAHTVQIVAEVYAAAHDGRYSVDAADLRPLMSRGNLLQNAFTGVYSEPQFAAAAAAPGQVGIELILQGGEPVGYTVTGFGKTELVTQLTNGN